MLKEAHWVFILGRYVSQKACLDDLLGKGKMCMFNNFED